MAKIINLFIGGPLVTSERALRGRDSGDGSKPKME